MIGHEMSAAAPAVLTLARLALGEFSEELGALGETHILRLPQRESVYRRCGPGATGRAMAIAHRFRCSPGLDFHSTAKAFALVRGHAGFPLSVDGSSDRHSSRAFDREFE